MSNVCDWRVSTVYVEGVPFEFDVQEFFAALDAAGVPKPRTQFGSYPKWAVAAFAAAGDAGLRWAKGVADESRRAFVVAIVAAHRLGGMDAVRQAARAFVGGGT